MVAAVREALDGPHRAGCVVPPKERGRLFSRQQQECAGPETAADQIDLGGRGDSGQDLGVLDRRRQRDDVTLGWRLVVLLPSRCSATPTLQRSRAQRLDPCAHSLDPHGRDAEKKRAACAAARTARQAKPNGSDGGNGAEITPAQTLWQHAGKLQPKAPWRAIVREFGINEAVAQDAYRVHNLPPGITGDAVTRFLELPAS